MNDILARAEERTRRAVGVIEELALLDRWAECGTPSLVGAARLGLVVKLDIDLNIYCEHPSIEQGFRVVSGIAPLRGVRRIRYSNCLETVDQGLYWQIQYMDRLGATWTIDNWLVSHDHPHRWLVEGLVERLPKLLTDEHRESILRIKESREADAGTQGIDIYQAVVGAGIRSPEQFAEWQQARCRPEISAWLPVEAP